MKEATKGQYYMILSNELSIAVRITETKQKGGWPRNRGKGKEISV